MSEGGDDFAALLLPGLGDQLAFEAFLFVGELDGFDPFTLRDCGVCKDPEDPLDWFQDFLGFAVAVETLDDLLRGHLG